MENFRNIVVWRRAMALAVLISRVTRQLPPEERHELGKQMRRSARGIHANFAEGCGRKVAGRSNADPLRSFAIASGELHELDSDVEYAMRAEYWPPRLAEPILEEIAEIRRMLAAFIAHRQGSRPPGKVSEGIQAAAPIGGACDLSTCEPVNLTCQPVNLATLPHGWDAGSG